MMRPVISPVFGECYTLDMKRTFPLSRVYRLLEPGPVVLVTTKWKDRSNVMTMSWHTMMDFEPPLIGCVIGGGSLTFEMLKASKECAINIPTWDLAAKVVGCGNTTGRKVDKIKRFGLTLAPAYRVRAPIIEDCYANIECGVADAGMAEKYNFFVLEAVHAWVDPSVRDPKTLHHRGRGAFMTAGKTIQLRSKAK